MLSPFADGLYRLVYGGLLVRLPEATAVRIGQSLFRSLPVARSGRSPSTTRGSPWTSRESGSPVR